MRDHVTFLTPFLAGCFFAVLGVVFATIVVVTAGIDALGQPAAVAITSALISGGLGIAGGTAINARATPPG